jgi:UDPglucose 6-dehydrogenase
MMNLQLSQNGPKPFATLTNTDQAKLAFIGLGKLGKDVSEVLSENFDLVGYDIRKSDAAVVQAASLRDAVAGRDIVFVAVQTPHEFEYDGRQPTSHLEPKDFDYQIVKEVIAEIDHYASRDTLLVLISTVLPGTVRREIAPLIKNCQFIYNPYLIAQGTVKPDMRNPEMIMIGTEDGTENLNTKLLIDVYRPISGPETRIEIGTWEEIESLKIFYNTFITAKLCLVNLVQDTAMSVGHMNADKVANALAKSNKRIMGPNYMRPGLGDGGGCHPRDNIALRSFAKNHGFSYDLFEAIVFAREKQAQNIANFFEAIGVEKNMTCVILGSGFKPGIPYEDGSPSLLVGHYLRELGYEVYSVPDASSVKCDEMKAFGPVAYLIGWYGYFKDFDFNPNSYVVDPWCEVKVTEQNSSKGIQVFHYGDTSQHMLGKQAG